MAGAGGTCDAAGAAGEGAGPAAPTRKGRDRAGAFGPEEEGGEFPEACGLDGVEAWDRAACGPEEGRGVVPRA